MTNRRSRSPARAAASLAALLALYAAPASAQSSAETNDYFGFAVASGDFDADGYDDVAIGAYNESISPGNLRGGMVEVHYGPASASIQLLHQDVAGIDGAVEAGDAFGHSLAVGDFNNDGFDDLAIAAPWENVDGEDQAGMIHVLYGSTSGLNTSTEKGFHQNSSGISGAVDFSDWFGYALAAGDFGRDGADDLAIGIPGETVNGAAGGAVAVLYGATGTGLSSTANALWHQNSTGIPGTSEPFDAFGAALAAGNFGYDSRDDLAIGNAWEDIGSVFAAGAVTIIYGSSTGLNSANSQGIDQDSPFMPNVPDPNDNLGFALAAARFGPGSYDALVIGVPGEADDKGMIHVLHGGSTGPGSSNVYAWDTSFAGVPGSPEAGDQFGTSLVAGDFNGDGLDDLAIGAPFEDVGTVVDAGAISVLYSDGSALGAAGAQIWDQDMTSIDSVAGTNDQFGLALGSADYDGDGINDLLAGTPYDEVFGVTNAGIVIHIEGRAGSGLTSSQGGVIHQ